MSADTLVTVAGIVVAFSISVLVFRIQREAGMESTNQRKWLPWADRLLVAANSLSLIVIALSTVLSKPPQAILAALTLGTLVLVFAYPFAALAHYRLIGGRGRTGERINPEPWEQCIVICASILAIGASVLKLAI